MTLATEPLSRNGADRPPVAPIADPVPNSAFVNPAILLAGTVDYQMYEAFRKKLSAAPEQGIVVVELSTLGGDPEVARMMGEDVRFHSESMPAAASCSWAKPRSIRPARPS